MNILRLYALSVPFGLLVACAAPGGANTPDIATEELRYMAGGAECTGYLAYDRNRPGPRPGVLIVHEWWGHNDYVRRRARMLAELGYTALALDMYGDGKRAEHPQDAQRFMQEVLGNMDAGVARFQAARQLLERHPSADPQRTAAIGYCFGGAVVLGMARSGADLDAVASFHGSLATQTPARPGAVKARILVCHGGADAMIPPEQVDAFRQEMQAAGANVQLVTYSQAMHGFTNPDATRKGEQFQLPLAYDADADQRSWQELQDFLAQTWR